MEDQSSGRDFGGQIRDLTRVLREQWWIVALCLVLAAFAAAAYTSTQKKEYAATAKLLLQTDNLSSSIAGAGLPGVDPTRQTATDAQLVALPSVARRVSKRLKEPLSATAVTTAAAPDSNIISVTVVDHNPRRAARFANAFANQYIVFRRDTTRQRYQRALRAVQTRLTQTRPNSPDAATLQAQAKQLRLLVSLQTGDAQVVQNATPPTAATSPNPERNIALGALIGLVIGFGLAFLRDRLDQRVKNEDQLEALLPGVPIVGLVPEQGRRRTSRQMTAEGFHSLQANLALLTRERPFKTLLVTSATPEEGKSTVALNLALAMGARSQSALILDADLRRPTLSERVKADRRVGVSSILAGQGSLAASVQERTVGPSRNGDGPNVALGGDVLLVPAGPVASNVQLLLNDQSLGRLLEEARERSEVAIFDGPPVGSFADMLPLAKEVDALLVVVRLYYSRRDQLKRFSGQLANAGIKPVGVVVLGASTGPSRYYADYLAKR